MDKDGFEVVIVGGGPIGIESALRARRRTENVCLLEKGRVGNHLRQWDGVELFTDFGMNHSQEANEWARIHDIELPDEDRYMSGKEYVEQWLDPLVKKTLLSNIVHKNVEVQSISRENFLKPDRVGSEDRGNKPFVLKIKSGGETQLIRSEVVMDASGTFGQPNPVGTGGMSAPGEETFQKYIHYDFPDQDELSKWTEDRVLLVGAGYSAGTNLLRLTGEESNGVETGRDPELYWLVRSPSGPPIRPIEDDPLEARARLTEQANEVADQPGVNLLRGTQVERIEAGEEYNLAVEFTDGLRLEVDRILANTGYRPDRSLYRELQFHECYATEGPIELSAQLLAQDGADCLEVDTGGADRIKTTEPNFYVVGSKSYGRNSQFLLRNGFRQLDDLFNSLLKEKFRGD